MGSGIEDQCWPSQQRESRACPQVLLARPVPHHNPQMHGNMNFSLPAQDSVSSQVLKSAGFVSVAYRAEVQVQLARSKDIAGPEL